MYIVMVKMSVQILLLSHTAPVHSCTISTSVFANSVTDEPFTGQIACNVVALASKQGKGH